MFNLMAIRASTLGCRGLQAGSFLSSAKLAGVSHPQIHAPLSNYALRALTTSAYGPAQAATKEEDFFAKNKRLSRPMSPHLTIYKLEITTLLSITHRGTGLWMSGLASSFAIGTLFLPSSFPTYISILQASHYGPAIIFIAKFALAWPFMFHLCNGIRHLAWDMGKGFELKTLYATGYAVLATSLLSALFLAAY